MKVRSEVILSNSTFFYDPVERVLTQGERMVWEYEEEEKEEIKITPSKVDGWFTKLLKRLGLVKEEVKVKTKDELDLTLG